MRLRLPGNQDSFSQWVRSGEINRMPSDAKEQSGTSTAIKAATPQPWLDSSADLAPASIFTRGAT